MKSWKTPTNDQITKALLKMVQVEHRRYFFDRLNNPLWIKPLVQKRVFASPPPPLEDKSAGTISFPLWPVSRYLARVSPEAPSDLVLEAINAIPETKNTQIHEDLAEAANSLSAKDAASLVNRVSTWLESKYSLYSLPKKVTKLSINLMENGQQKEGLALARELVDITVSEKSKSERRKDIEGKIEEWEYDRIVKQLVPVTVTTCGLRGLRLWMDSLRKALDLSRSSEKHHDDISYIWRSKIDEEPSSTFPHIENSLVTAIKNAAELICLSDPSQAPHVIQELEKETWKVFHRISLVLVRKFGDAASVKSHLLQKQLLLDEWSKGEYTDLLRDKFTALSDSEKQVFFEWLEQGPDLSDEQAEDPARALRIFKFWQRDHLELIKDHLPEAWAVRLESLKKDLGPAGPIREEFMTSWSGPTSPKSSDELAAMTPAETINFLREWKPPPPDRAPSPEGLARMLVTCIEKNVDKYAPLARSFKGLDPTYIRAFFQGINNCLKSATTLDWEPVIGLAAWVVEQPRKILGREVPQGWMHSDPDWGWTRKEIARVVHSGAASETCPLPAIFRTNISKILEQLLDDPDPSKDERPNGKDGTGWLDLAINSVRTEALHALIQYAMWVRKVLGTDHFKGMDSIPEVRAKLERHLIDSTEPSPATRAVYGRWFPWLHLLDEKWAASNVTRIFSQTSSDLWDASWKTYILFCHPYDKPFRLLKAEYGRAIDQLKTDDQLSNYQEHLGQHLILLYLRGKVKLGDDGMFDAFWRKASPALQEKSLEQIGYMFYHTQGDLPEEALKRSKDLWRFIFTKVTAGVNQGNKSKELSAFGWWFVSKKFDDEWSLRNLVESLKSSTRMDLDHLVIERLAKLATKYPAECVEALDLIVDLDVFGWSVSGTQAEPKAILEAAITSGNKAAKRMATQLINRLGKKGIFGFKDLLGESQV